MADLLQSFNNNDNISMNISLSGSNLFQAGNQSVEYVISSGGTGSVGINGYRNTEDAINELRTAAVDSLLDVEYRSIFEQSYKNVIKGGIAAHDQFSGAIGSAGNFTTTFSQNPVSQAMQMIAKTIKSRQTLGMKRQTFFVMFGGWDHHDEVLNNQTNMLPVVSKALNELYRATVEIGIADKTCN